MAGKQRGSTLLGLVIGGVLGLGVALALALYITKVPVPLVNKIPQHNFDSDAAELRKNKDWNPNASLAGKSLIRPAPAASGETTAMNISLPTLPASDQASAAGRAVKPKVVAIGPAEPAIVAAPVAPAVTAAPAKVAKARPVESLDDDLPQSIPAVPASPSKPAKSSDDPLQSIPAVSAATLKPAKSGTTPIAPVTATPAIASTAPARPTKPVPADPIGDLARTRSADLASPAAASDPFNYFVQAGAFRTPEEAEKQRNRLQAMGMNSRVTEREQAGRMVYRVRVGPFDKKDEADRTKAKMESQSIDTALVRVQR